jgi:hypothetical protein
VTQPDDVLEPVDRAEKVHFDGAGRPGSQRRGSNDVCADAREERSQVERACIIVVEGLTGNSVGAPVDGARIQKEGPFSRRHHLTRVVKSVELDESAEANGERIARLSECWCGT